LIVFADGSFKTGEQNHLFPSDLIYYQSGTERFIDVAFAIDSFVIKYSVNIKAVKVRF